MKNSGSNKPFYRRFIMKRFLLLALAVVAVQAQSTKTAVPKSVTAQDFSFTYSLDDKNLTGKVTHKGTGWLAIGFKPTTVMKNANIILGTLVDGHSVVVDQFGSGMFSHEADTVLSGQNNLVSSELTESNGVTVLTFTIPLNSGDSKDVILKAGETIKVIFAAGKSWDAEKKHIDDAKVKITL